MSAMKRGKQLADELLTIIDATPDTPDERHELIQRALTGTLLDTTTPNPQRLYTAAYALGFLADTILPAVPSGQGTNEGNTSHVR